MTIRDQVRQEFEKQYQCAPPIVVRAPGRVNLIGEHTDYNDGFVLPMTIDRAVWIALRPRPDDLVVVRSIGYSGTKEFRLNQITRTNSKWLEYIKGVAWAMQEAGHKLNGWEGVLMGNVPLGAGLSSSAALEMATARAFAAVSQLTWQPADMAKIGQRAENKWVGVNCGIMDQMISAAGQSDHALLIDCRSLETKPVPIPPGTVIAVLDTTTRRGLVGSAYNDRRAQCEAAAKFFSVRALRDVSLKQFEARVTELDDVTRRRARHVISENERTLRAAEVMQQGDATTLGQLMNQSHESLRDDFEVSSKELNIIVNCARATTGCLGARMTGAGFGGCAVALVRSDAVDEFTQAVTASYKLATRLDAQVYVCQATNGAEVVS